MKKLKLLWMILKRTKATQILSGYIVFLFVSAAIIQLVEPDINRYGDASGIAMRYFPPLDSAILSQ